MKRVDEDGDEWITDNSGEYRPLKKAEKDEARFIKGMFLFPRRNLSSARYRYWC